MSALQFNARKKFHLLQSKTRTWETNPEHLEHYRIIFVIAGEGNFILGDQIRNYAKQGIIFLKPGQRVIFQEDRETEVFMIAFDTYLAEDFQKKKAYTPDFADTYKQAENLCSSLRLTQGKPLQNEHDCQTIAYLVSQMSFEVVQRSVSYVRLIQGSVDLFVTVLARNNFASKKIDEKTTQQTVADAMIEHLRNELHQNKSIRIREMLMRFNISEEAANLCIMNKTGMSLRNFIFKYKADLFKSRMLKIDVMELSPYLRTH